MIFRNLGNTEQNWTQLYYIKLNKTKRGEIHELYHWYHQKNRWFIQRWIISRNYSRPRHSIVSVSFIIFFLLDYIWFVCFHTFLHSHFNIPIFMASKYCPFTLLAYLILASSRIPTFWASLIILSLPDHVDIPNLWTKSFLNK